MPQVEVGMAAALVPLEMPGYSHNKSHQRATLSLPSIAGVSPSNKGLH